MRRAIEPVLVGHRIKTVLARRPDLRIPLPKGFAGRVQGRKVLSVDRRAKYIVIRLDDGNSVIAHLGMSGRMMAYDDGAPPPGPHDHVDIVTDAGRTIRFRDPRRFGLMTLAETAHLDEHKLFRHLGPDPLGNEFGGKTLAASLEGRATSIKAALLDQSTVAGVGNIYACEALFRAGISPKRLAKTVQGQRARKLAEAIRQVLLEAIAAGGSSLRDHVLPSGELGYFQHSWRVYGREGEPCPGCTCDLARTGGIRRIVQNGRSSFYCTTRQR